MDQLTPESQVASSLFAAALLAFTSGILDALLHIAQGKVFAGATMRANYPPYPRKLERCCLGCMPGG